MWRNSRLYAAGCRSITPDWAGACRIEGFSESGGPTNRGPARCWWRTRERQPIRNHTAAFSGATSACLSSAFCRASRAAEFRFKFATGQVPRIPSTSGRKKRSIAGRGLDAAEIVDRAEAKLAVTTLGSSGSDDMIRDFFDGGVLLRSLENLRSVTHHDEAGADHEGVIEVMRCQIALNRVPIFALKISPIG